MVRYGIADAKALGQEELGTDKGTKGRVWVDGGEESGEAAHRLGRHGLLPQDMGKPLEGLL